MDIFAMSSSTLSKNIHTMIGNGMHFTDTSTSTDRALANVMKRIIEYSKSRFPNVSHRASLSLYECQERFGLVPPDPSKKKVAMKPDGGILMSDKTPILLSEMKVQGTNDLRLSKGLPRQALGNAIERASKNIRGAEMIFDDLPVFPYVIFAAGCDFHPDETIASRFEMMNYGIQNKTIVVTEHKTRQDILEELRILVEGMDINKKRNKSIASIFVKTHKWNQLPHGSSLWTEEEIFFVLKSVIDKVYTSTRPPSSNDSPSSSNP